MNLVKRIMFWCWLFGHDWNDIQNRTGYFSFDNKVGVLEIQEIRRFDFCSKCHCHRVVKSAEYQNFIAKVIKK
jgi:hypothetical protein